MAVPYEEGSLSPGFFRARQKIGFGLVQKCLSCFSAAASAPAWVVAYVLRTRFLLELLVCVFGERFKNVHHDFMKVSGSLMNLHRKCTGKKKKRTPCPPILVRGGCTEPEKFHKQICIPICPGKNVAMATP